MVPLDFKILQECLNCASRKAYLQLRAINEKEEFYAFALVAQSEANHISAVASGKASLESQIKKAAFPKDDLLSLFDLKWVPGNWEYFGIGEECFKGVHAQLNNDALDEYFESEELAIERFQADVFAAMTLSLLSLKSSREFSSDITLFCCVEDSECGEWLAIDSARRLNDAKNFKVFKRECIDGLELEAKSNNIIQDLYQERLLMSGLK